METLQTQPTQPSTERLNSFGFWLGVFAFLVGIDQATKFLAQNLHWEIFQNYNFAFSLPIPSVVMFVVYAAVLILIARYVYKIWTQVTLRTRLAWLLILAGGISNVMERIILGYVRDFIPVGTGMFNLADFMIIAGALLVLTTRVRR